MLVSYCTTCMGRLWQLRQTLPEHLRFFDGRSDVEIVLLDYNSQDGLEQWIRSNDQCLRAIDSGLLVYLKEGTVTHFHSSKAKNLAHRLATGEVLVNLDCDNWATEIDAPIRAAFDTAKDVIFHAYSQRRGDGTCGRIAICRSWFYLLGGYDESFQPAGYQDIDLIKRASLAGLRIIPFVHGRKPIRNSVKDKIALTGSSYSHQEMSKLNQRLSVSRIATGKWVANGLGWGSAAISRNFGRSAELPPEISTAIAGRPGTASNCQVSG